MCLKPLAPLDDNIDTSFVRWSMKLHEEDVPTIPFLMRSYINLDNVLVISDMIEEAPISKPSSSHTH